MPAMFSLISTCLHMSLMPSPLQTSRRRFKGCLLQLSMSPRHIFKGCLLLIPHCLRRIFKGCPRLTSLLLFAHPLFLGPAEQPKRPYVFFAQLFELMFQRSRSISLSTSAVDSSTQRPKNASPSKMLFYQQNRLVLAAKPAISNFTILTKTLPRPAILPCSNTRHVPSSCKNAPPMWSSWTLHLLLLLLLLLHHPLFPSRLWGHNI